MDKNEMVKDNNENESSREDILGRARGMLDTQDMFDNQRQQTEDILDFVKQIVQRIEIIEQKLGIQEEPSEEEQQEEESPLNNPATLGQQKQQDPMQMLQSLLGGGQQGGQPQQSNNINSMG